MWVGVRGALVGGGMGGGEWGGCKGGCGERGWSLRGVGDGGWEGSGLGKSAEGVVVRYDGGEWVRHVFLVRVDGIAGCE